MKINCRFQDLDHSSAVEEFVAQKMAHHLTELIRPTDSPQTLEVHIKKNRSFNVEAELRVRDAFFAAHAENFDLYVAIEQTIDRLVTQLKKHKSKSDSLHKMGDPDKKKIV